jgi:hypothetical protein
MATTRQELLNYFVKQDDPNSKYWSILLNYVAIHSSAQAPLIQALGTTASPSFTGVTAQRFSTGTTTTAQTMSGSNYTFHKMYGKVATWSPTTTVTGMEIVAWSTANVVAGLELRGAEIKASVDKTGTNDGIATSIYAKVTNKGASPTLAVARGLHVYIENDAAGGTITKSSVLYVEYGLGTHTAQYLIDFAAVGGVIATPASPGTIATPDYNVKCIVGSQVFYLKGYKT